MTSLFEVLQSRDRAIRGTADKKSSDDREQGKDWKGARLTTLRRATGLMIGRDMWDGAIYVMMAFLPVVFSVAALVRTSTRHGLVGTPGNSPAVVSQFSEVFRVLSTPTPHLVGAPPLLGLVLVLAIVVGAASFQLKLPIMLAIRWLSLGGLLNSSSWAWLISRQFWNGLPGSVGQWLAASAPMIAAGTLVPAATFGIGALLDATFPGVRDWALGIAFSVVMTLLAFVAIRGDIRRRTLLQRELRRVDDCDDTMCLRRESIEEIIRELKTAEARLYWVERIARGYASSGKAPVGNWRTGASPNFGDRASTLLAQLDERWCGFER